MQIGPVDENRAADQMNHASICKDCRWSLSKTIRRANQKQKKRRQIWKRRVSESTNIPKFLEAIPPFQLQRALVLGPIACTLPHSLKLTIILGIPMPLAGPTETLHTSDQYVDRTICLFSSIKLIMSRDWRVQGHYKISKRSTGLDLCH